MYHKFLDKEQNHCEIDRPCSINYTPKKLLHTALINIFATPYRYTPYDMQYLLPIVMFSRVTKVDAAFLVNRLLVLTLHLAIYE